MEVSVNPCPIAVVFRLRYFVRLLPFSPASEPQSSQRSRERRSVAGQKRSHWMWFIFPQIKGLGSSPTAQRFAISSIALPTPRLVRCVGQSVGLARMILVEVLRRSPGA
jgi:uncharacterized protein (DUF1810 family)